jgi:hypothetical protein
MPREYANKIIEHIGQSALLLGPKITQSQTAPLAWSILLHKRSV